MKTFMSWLVCSFLAAGICLLANQRSATAEAAPGCWLVFYISTGEQPGAIADEVICLTSQTAGVVRESSIFGTGVKGCNRVTVDRKGGAMNLTVDYSKCTNNSPSHTIACPSPSAGRFKCEWTMLDKKTPPSAAYLVREKR